MRRALVCVVVAGCGGGTGTALEITGPGATETVELFLGNSLVYKDDSSDSVQPMCPIEAPDMCVVRAPDPFDVTKRGEFHSGHGWISKAMKATRSTATDGTFGFSLEPDSESYIGALLVVGLDANEMPTGYALLHDLTVDSSPEVLQIKLSAAQYIAPPASDIDRIQVWRRPGDDRFEQSACALIEKTDHAVEWFVPKDDTDCDGALPDDDTAPECASSEWTSCGRYAGSLDTAACAMFVNNGGGDGCRWAGPECADHSPRCDLSTPPPQACAPTEQIACFPTQVCSQIGSTNCNSFDNTDPAYCIPAILRDTAYANTTPYLSCTFYMETPTTPCGGVWPSVPTVLNTAVLTQNTACQRMELAQFGSPMQLGNKVPFNATNTIELKPGSSCTTGTFELSITTATTGSLEGSALVGLITTDYKRRYFAFSQDVYFLPTNCGLQRSVCNWKGAQTYNYSCN